MNNKKRMRRNKRIMHWHLVFIYLVAYDVLAVTAAYLLALLVRFDFSFSRIPIVYLQPWEYFSPIYAIVSILIFWCCRLYKSIWRFASFKELQRITVATIITTIFHIVGITLMLHAVIKNTEYTMDRMPISYYIMGAIFQALLITVVRFSYRFVLLLRASKDKKSYNSVMLIGAGSAGQLILRDIRRTSSVDKHSAMEERVVAIIDDNINKWGRDIDGVPVVGIANIIGTIPANS